MRPGDLVQIWSQRGAEPADTQRRTSPPTRQPWGRSSGAQRESGSGHRTTLNLGPPSPFTTVRHNESCRTRKNFRAACHPRTMVATRRAWRSGPEHHANSETGARAAASSTHVPNAILGAWHSAGWHPATYRFTPSLWRPSAAPAQTTYPNMPSFSQ